MSVTRRHLTDEQRRITLNTTSHLMVEAGAGSGKTTLLIEKLAYELGHGNIDGQLPETVLDIGQVAAITFTRKAAGEIKERLRTEFLRRADRAEGRERETWASRAFALDEALIGTIDAFAGQIIRDYGALVGVESGFEILEPGDAAALRQEIVETEILAGVERDVPGAVFLVRHFGFRRSCAILASFLNDATLLLDVADRLQDGRMSLDRLAQKGEITPTAKDYILEPHGRAIVVFARAVHDAYVRRMNAEGVLDHEHVVLRAAALAEHVEVQRAFQERIKLLLVDEYQDTSHAQARLLFRLTGISGAARAAAADRQTPPTRLVLVGDPKQSIYGFRHADITLWQKSKKMLEQAGGLYHTLTTNHRSRPSLVRFIDDCFGRILGKEGELESDYDVPFRPLTPMRNETDGRAVEILLAKEAGAKNVAEIVADRIREMLDHPDNYPVFERADDSTEVRRPLKARDIAILSRNLKGAADHYERALRERGIDSYVYGGRGLYARQEIADLTTLLRAVADPHDTAALVAFLRSPMGGMDDATLAELAAVSSAEQAGRSLGSLYDALLQAEVLVSSPAGRDRAQRAVRLLEKLRALRDRLPHHQLIETALEESGYRAFLAGAPDAPAGIRNVEKLLRIARRAAHEPLFEFVRKLGARVQRADPEEEAPLYTPDDDLVTISTIHKAKGLEWPYVFVVGIDEPMFRKINGSEPHLSRRMGIVLPLEVMLREAGASPAEISGSAVWDRYFEDATRREYAEAKRLFYVAATRARDRLILAGALKDTTKPRRLTGRIDKLHQQGYEYWLRHLYQPLTRAGEEGATFRYADGQHLGVIRRAADAPESNPDAAGQANVGSVVQARHWLPAPPASLLAYNDATPRLADLERRTGPVTTRTPLRGEFTASELLQFSICEWRHYYGYLRSISSPTIEVASRDAVVNQILPEKRGEILHDYLREYRESWSEKRQQAEMKKALLRHLPMSEEDADENARELLAHASNYLRSEWYARVRAAKNVLREIPFVAQVTPTLRLRGKIDLMFEEEDGWRIIDFKTGLFRGLEHRIEEEIAQRTKTYELQAAVYSLAAVAAGFPVREFVFFFTAPALAGTIRPDANWLSQQQLRIELGAARIQALDYGAEPVYEARRCEGCEFFALCRPKGAPAHLVASSEPQRA